jgi:hypothetical protein
MLCPDLIESARICCSILSYVTPYNFCTIVQKALIEGYSLDAIASRARVALDNGIWSDAGALSDLGLFILSLLAVMNETLFSARLYTSDLKMFCRLCEDSNDKEAWQTWHKWG